MIHIELMQLLELFFIFLPVYTVHSYCPVPAKLVKVRLQRALVNVMHQIIELHRRHSGGALTYRAQFRFHFCLCICVHFNVSLGSFNLLLTPSSRLFFFLTERYLCLALLRVSPTTNTPCHVLASSACQWLTGNVLVLPSSDANILTTHYGVPPRQDTAHSPFPACSVIGFQLSQALTHYDNVYFGAVLPSLSL